MGVRLLEGLGTILLFLAPGFGLATLLLGPRVRGALRLACAYLLGLAWVAGGLFVVSHVLSMPIRRAVILALVALPVAAGAVVSLRHSPVRARVLRR